MMNGTGAASSAGGGLPLRHANQYSALFVSVLVLLGGCSAEVGSSTGALGEVCEPDHSTPILDVETGTVETGTATINVGDGTVDIHLSAAEGWELGDFYITLGLEGVGQQQFPLNPEPWVTGYFSELDLSVPIEDLGLTCDMQVEVTIQGHSRDASGRIFVSALGDRDSGGYGWHQTYDLCCAPVDMGCTESAYYWRRHRRAWPVDTVRLGNRDYSRRQARHLMRRGRRGDASVALANQLIAAELNAASGASPAAELADAQAWMSANGRRLPYRIRRRSAAGREAIALTRALRDYNRGVTGPGSCED